MGKEWHKPEEHIGEVYGTLEIIGYKRCNDSNKIRFIYKCQKCGATGETYLEAIKKSAYKKNIDFCKKCDINIKHAKEIGKTYGKLTIESFFKRGNRIYCKCVCACGEPCEVRFDKLTGGKTVKCGNCGKNIPAGTKFGDITIIKYLYSAADYIPVYQCECSCGTIFEAKLNNLKNGNTTSCGCRTLSKGAEQIENILLNNNISYTKEYTYNDCKDINKLRFDFKIDTINGPVLIEYDGKQHFEPVEKFGGQEGFILTTTHDSIKNEYCLSHNIPLIRIPYTHTDITLEDLQPETSQFLLTKL